MDNKTAMSIKIGSAKGEYEKGDYFEVLAYSWGITQGGSRDFGTGGGLGHASIHDLSITIRSDKGLATLMGFCLKGTQVGDAEFICKRAGGTAPVKEFSMKMESIILTSVAIGGGQGDDFATANVSINFKEVKFSSFSQSDKGGAGSSIDIKYDQHTHKIT